MKYSFTFAALAAAVSLTSAQHHQAAPYGRCGGRGHHGPTSCAPGFHCHEYNEWYAQCIAGTSSSSVAAPTSLASTGFLPVPSANATYSVLPTGTAVSNYVPLPSSNATSKCTNKITLTKSSTASVGTISPIGGNGTYPSFPSGTGPAVYGSITLTYPAFPTAPSSTADAVASSSGTAPASYGSVALNYSAFPSSASSAATTLQTKAVSTSIVTSSSAAASTTKASSSAAAATSASAAAATGSYPRASGSKFVIDGETGYFAGTNSYWIGFLTDNNDVDTVMQHLKESGLKILRVWGFNDVTTTPASGTVYFQSFAGSEPTINTGADGLERLDYVVKSAEAHGIKLMINFVNNWTDYGGMAAYFTYAGITDNTQWYNNTKAQTQYQKYIKAVVSRYPDSSAIFAWELANEPRCTGCDLSIMKAWITDTAKYIKGLDANRMVTTGEEGFGLSTGDDGTYPYTTGAGGYDFAANCAIENIDFCTYHLYPDSWSVSPAQSWGNAWITNHGKACAAAGKPCLLEEFGYNDNCTVESVWQATALKATGTGGDLFWQYGDTLSTGQTSQDGNTVYCGESLYTCLVTNHISAIDAA